MSDFKHEHMIRVKGALLAFAVNGLDFTAADLPAEITKGDVHLAGAASGSLVAMNFIWVVGRVKSPDLAANGRKLNIFRLCNGRLATVRAWFREQGMVAPVIGEVQLNLIAS